MSLKNASVYSELKITIDYQIDDLILNLKGIRNIQNHFEDEIEFWKKDHFTSHNLFKQFYSHYQQCLKTVNSLIELDEEFNGDHILNNWNNKRGC